MGLTTFVFTDIEGSTRLLTEAGPRYATILSDHHEIVRSCVAAHDGIELGTEGDAFSIRFDSPVAALAAAIDIQRRLAEWSRRSGQEVRVRLGIHTGEVVQTAWGFVGLPLHETARITAAGHGGQILLSGTTADLVAGCVPAGVTLKDLGPHLLKDLADPRRLFQACHPDLPASFPPVRTLSTLPNNLPQQASTFIGRDDDIRSLVAALEASRLITLVGPGGTGKTRLALQVAAETLVRYPGGAWFVDLAAVTAAEAVPAAIAAAVQVRTTSPRPQLEVVADALADSPTLVILDNCEHLIEACARAADQLMRKTKTIGLLATSREPMNIDGEKLWPLRPLSLPPSDGDAADGGTVYEAVELFEARARMKNPDLVWDRATERHVVEICRRLDGIPLAIELAAAKTAWLSPRQIAERLDDRFSFLTNGNRVALPRQRTLRSLIEWSYDLLDETERSLFAQLAVFRGSFDLEVVNKVCEAAAGCEGVLGALVSKSLVARLAGRNPPRFRFLDTIHAFAEERLLESGVRNDLFDRHLAHYVEVLEQAEVALQGSDQGSWMERLAADEPNVVAALEWAVETDRADEAARLLPGLVRYWDQAGKWHEAHSLVKPALPLLEQAEPRWAAIALLAAATVQARVSSFEKGRALANRAIRLARDLEDPCLEARALVSLTVNDLFEGRLDLAASIQADAVDRGRKGGCGRLMPSLLYNRGFVLTGLGRDEEAAEVLAEAKLLAEIEDQPAVGASVALVQAWQAVAAGDGTTALDGCLEALDVLEPQGNTLRVLYVVEGMAGAFAVLGRGAVAARLFGATEAIRRRGGVKRALSVQPRHDALVDISRANCPREQFAAAWEEGSQLSLGEAVALARGAAQP